MQDIYHSLNSEPVESARDDFIAVISFASFDSISISLFSLSSLHVFLISRGERVRELIFPCNVRRLGRNREGNSTSAHSFINIYPHLNPSGTEFSASPFSASFPPIRCSSRPPHLRGRTPGRVFVLANLLYVSYADLHL